MKKNSMIVLSIACLYISSALSMELTTPMHDTIPAFEDATIRSLREQLIIPTEKYKAVDNFYKKICDEYIKQKFNNQYHNIVKSLDKEDSVPHDKLREFLDEADCDIVIVWHSQYLKMRDLHLIKVSHNADALEKLNNLPGLQAYMRDYFAEYHRHKQKMESPPEFFLTID